jgi:ankyrin repeat protein
LCSASYALLPVLPSDKPSQALLPSSFRDYSNVPFALDTVFITYDDPEIFRAKFPVHAAALSGNALELRARLFPRVVGTERTGGGCDPSSAMRPMSAASRKNRVIVDARDGVGWTALHHAAARGHLNCVAALVNGEATAFVFARSLCCDYFTAGADAEATTWTQGWSAVILAAMCRPFINFNTLQLNFSFIFVDAGTRTLTSYVFFSTSVFPHA